MFGLQVRVEDKTSRVRAEAENATFRNLGHASASISRDVKSTLIQAFGPSDPGTPPHTHRGTFLRRGIRYAYDKESAVIGPMASVVGQSGAAHEFGGRYRGDTFPERPYMEPALRRAAPRFADRFYGSIGE